jgi:hypothetical protein
VKEGNMNVLKALALGAVVGFLFSFSMGCPASTCSSANCLGCCDSTGKCVLTANETAAKCGTGGNKCATCTGSQVCTAGVCTACSGANCNAGDAGCGQCPTGCCSGSLCISGIALTSTSCGSGGGSCNNCANTVGSGATCQVGATGGTCIAAGPDGGPSGGVGDPCTVDSDCTTLKTIAPNSTGVKCLLATADGGAAYPGGYCTIVSCSKVAGNANACPASTLCVPMGTLTLTGQAPFIDLYGETRTMCLSACVSDFDCNIPQYTCFGGDQLNAARTDFDTTKPGLGCFISVPGKTNETGTACNPTDTSAAGFELCALPPTNGGCYAFGLPDGGSSPGVCGSDCLSALVDQANGPDFWCGAGGICLVTGPNNAAGFPIQAICEQKCTAPNGGASNCTQGNVCWGGITFPDGGMAPFGFCQPDCHTLGGNSACGGGTTCSDAGSCM